MRSDSAMSAGAETAALLPANQSYDIVIAGGGMVGLSLACAIAQADTESVLSILLVDSFPLKSTAACDKKPAAQYHPSFDARSTALSLASIEIYQAIGVLPALLKHAEAIRQIHVSDKGHGGSTLLDAQEQSKQAFGYVVENQWLGAVLLERMAELPAIELLSGASVANIKPRQKGVSLDVTRLNKERQLSGATEDSQTIDAALLVLADGAQSGLGASLGISASVKHYAQHAIIANIQTQLPHQGLAFERFVEDGAVAFLPLPDLAEAKNRSALVWTVPADSKLISTGDCGVDDVQFTVALQQAFGFRLGAIERVGQRQNYPLALTITDEVFRNHIVLMGNAAHSLHPVAGQGFNLALRDVAALTSRIIQAQQEQNDIGSLQLLEQYAQAQLADQNLTIGFSHNLIELFGLQAFPVQVGRSLGLIALDLLQPAKNIFADQAAGLGGRKWL